MTEQIDFANIIRRVLRQWTVIVMLGVIVALGAGIVASRRYHPQYETKAIIVVYGKESFRGSVKSARETADVFKEVIGSSLLQKKVAEAMGLTSLPGTISCESIPNTNMITLKVRAASPQNTMLVMNGLLEYYGEAVPRLLSNIVLQVLEEPKVPTRAAEAFEERQLLVKLFLLTAAAVAAVMFLYYYFRDDIKNEEEVEKKLDAGLFASVYHENLQKGFAPFRRKAKVGILVNNPAVSFGYVETFQKLCMKLDYRMKQQGGKTVLVTSVQENEGKTTVSANLALSLAKRGKKVLLVDCDLRKPAQYKLFGQTYGKGNPQIGNVLAGKETPQQAVRTLRDTEMLLLAGSRSYKNATKLVVSRTAEQAFAQMAEEVDYVILDTPPLYLTADTEELMRYADAGLLVVRQNCSRVRDINDAVDIFKKADCPLLGCVLNNLQTGLLGGVSTLGDGYQYRYSYGYGYYKKRNKEPKENS